MEKEQEGETEIAKAMGKGIAGSHRWPIAESGLSGGGQAEELAALKCQKLAEGDTAEAGKRKKIARVSQKYIDILLKEKATGTGAYKVSKAKEIVEKYKGHYDVRALVAKGDAIMEELRAGDAKILEQYERHGYAFTEVEEDNSFIYDEKIFGPIARSSPPVPQA
jgi:hypothetical protein